MDVGAGGCRILTYTLNTICGRTYKAQHWNISRRFATSAALTANQYTPPPRVVSFLVDEALVGSQLGGITGDLLTLTYSELPKHPNNHNLKIIEQDWKTGLIHRICCDTAFLCFTQRFKWHRSNAHIAAHQMYNYSLHSSDVTILHKPTNRQTGQHCIAYDVGLFRVLFVNHLFVQGQWSANNHNKTHCQYTRL